MTKSILAECFRHSGAERAGVHLTIDNAQPDRAMPRGCVVRTVRAGEGVRFALVINLAGRAELCSAAVPARSLSCFLQW